MRTPDWLQRQVAAVEGAAGLDPMVDRVRPLVDVAGAGTAGDLLRGQWLGHALHPLLTDFPLGCWASAGLLDLLGGSTMRPAAQRLVGLGLLFVPLTTASGAADLSVVGDQRVKRVGTIHAVGNVGVATLYYLSWRARRRGRHTRGVALGMVGGLLAWVTGYLGGHMSFARGTGTGDRGLEGPEIPAVGSGRT